MSEPFADLRASGKPAADVKRFYRTSGQLDTLAHVVQVATEARVLAARHGTDLEAANLAALAHDLAAVVPVAGFCVSRPARGKVHNALNSAIICLALGLTVGTWRFRK